MVDQDRASNIVVHHDVQMQGRMTSHQIDVLWEFRLAGVAHRDNRDHGHAITLPEGRIRAPFSMYPGETVQFILKARRRRTEDPRTL
jgi:hypothetical protein